MTRFGVVPIASLHDKVFLLCGQRDFVVRDSGVGWIRRISQTVLIAQFFLDLAERFINGVLFGSRKEPSAGFLGESHEDFLAVRPRFLRTRIRISTAVPAHAASHSASHAMV